MGWLLVLFHVRSCSWRADSVLSPVFGLGGFCILPQARKKRPAYTRCVFVEMFFL